MPDALLGPLPKPLPANANVPVPIVADVTVAELAAAIVEACRGAA